MSSVLRFSGDYACFLLFSVGESLGVGEDVFCTGSWTASPGLCTASQYLLSLGTLLEPWNPKLYLPKNLPNQYIGFGNQDRTPAMSDRQEVGRRFFPLRCRCLFLGWSTWAASHTDQHRDSQHGLRSTPPARMREVMKLVLWNRLKQKRPQRPQVPVEDARPRRP